MKHAEPIARILLAIIFIASGISGFFLVNNPPQMPPGLAMSFQTIFFQSRWVLFVDGLELIAGALLLVNRCVPLALTVLAGIIYNMFVFHITMMPIGLPAPLLLLIMVIIVANRHRAAFLPLFAPKA
jgi:putative oxidoreductase